MQQSWNILCTSEWAFGVRHLGGRQPVVVCDKITCGTSWKVTSFINAVYYYEISRFRAETPHKTYLLYKRG